MKIIMMSVDYLPNIGGIAAHIYHLSNALMKMGHSVIIVNPVASTGAKVELSEAPIPVIRLFYREPGTAIGRFVVPALASVRGLPQAIRWLGGVDVIHQHDHMIANAACRLFRRKAPWVWTNHSSGFLHDYESPRKRRLVTRAYRGVNSIIGVSQELSDKSKALWPHTPLYDIPNGVDTELYTPDIQDARCDYPLRPDDFVVLCPRRMMEKNGVYYLAQAVNIVLRRRPDVPWKFVFLGTEYAAPVYAKYINKVKDVLAPAERAGHVLNLGNLPMSAMPGINAAADLVVMPSLMEAISLSALEAMATRKPLVATDVGGLPEIVRQEETGLLVPPRNPDALADAMIRMWDDPALREKVAAGGYKLATSEYAWSRVAEQTLEVYHAARNHHRPT